MFNTKSARLSAVILFVFAVSAIAGSCKKKNESEASRITLLTTSTWKYKEAGVDNNVDGVIDSPFPLAQADSCQTDFILTFKSDKTGINDEGPKKCNPTDPQTTPFTWDITNNDTELTLSATILASLGGGKLKILDITKDKMTLATSVTVPGLPIVIPATVILVHP